MFKKQPRMEVVAAPEGKKSCLVVGAGASGLAVMKELTALNHKLSRQMHGQKHGLDALYR